MFEATGFKDIIRTNIAFCTNGPRNASMDIVIATHADGLMMTWVDVQFTPRGTTKSVHVTFGNRDEAAKYYDSIDRSM